MKLNPFRTVSDATGDSEPSSGEGTMDRDARPAAKPTTKFFENVAPGDDDHDAARTDGNWQKEGAQ
jgi:hypothetical protein